MAGERLYDIITSRSGTASDYADTVYGLVLKTKPLQIQIANNMIIDDNFVVLGKHIGKIKIKGKANIKSHSDSIGSVSGNRPSITEEVEYTFDNSLKIGDKVTLIRGDGGQSFYLLERKDKKGYGF